MIKIIAFVFALNVTIQIGISFSQKRTLYCDGRYRTYILRVPDSYNDTTSVPIVIGLHGYSASAADFESSSELYRKSDAEGFIAVCPNATGNPTMWNAGGAYEVWTNGVDDVKFISTLIDTLCKTYSIDTTRIFATGYSNGSFMAYRLAAELSDKIAAIGAVAGQMVLQHCEPERPIPIIHFHGLDDTSVPYDGTNISGLIVPSVNSVISLWIEKNGCQSKHEIIYNQNGIIGKQWASPDSVGDIVLYSIPGYGHGWPKLSDAGISATTVIWKFFKSHPMRLPKNTQDSTKNIDRFMLSQNYPNPFTLSTTIRYGLPKSTFVTLKVYNLLGEEIQTIIKRQHKEGEHELIWTPNHLPNGIYLYRLVTGDFVETKKILLMR